MPFSFFKGYELRSCCFYFFAKRKKSISVRFGISVSAMGKEGNVTIRDYRGTRRG